MTPVNSHTCRTGGRGVVREGVGAGKEGRGGGGRHKWALRALVGHERLRSATVRHGPPRTAT